MAVLLKARYVGRVEKARETLALIQSQRKKLEQDIEVLTTSTRKNLAAKIRQLRQRVYSRGIQNAEQRCQRSLTRELLNLDNQLKQSLKRAQAECLSLSLRVAETVIGTTAPNLTDGLSERISAALMELRDSRPVIIEVNTDDHEAVTRGLATRRMPMPAKVQVAGDVECGKARIVTNAGSLRIDWKEHLEQLKADLREAQKKDRLLEGQS